MGGGRCSECLPTFKIYSIYFSAGAGSLDCCLLDGRIEPIYSFLYCSMDVVDDG